MFEMVLIVLAALPGGTGPGVWAERIATALASQVGTMPGAATARAPEPPSIARADPDAVTARAQPGLRV